jgi:hypothetical protein
MYLFSSHQFLVIVAIYSVAKYYAVVSCRLIGAGLDTETIKTIPHVIAM